MGPVTGDRGSPVTKAAIMRLHNTLISMQLFQLVPGRPIRQIMLSFLAQHGGWQLTQE